MHYSEKTRAENTSVRPLEPANTPENLVRQSTQLSPRSSLEERKRAAMMLWQVSGHQHTSELLFSIVTPHVFEILDCQDDADLRLMAMGILLNLSIPDANKQRLLEQGVLNVLVRSLKHRNHELRKQTLHVFAELSLVLAAAPAGKARFFELQSLDYLVDCAHSHDEELQIIALRTIWLIVINIPECHGHFMDNRGLHRFIQLGEHSPNVDVRQLAKHVLETLEEHPACREYILGQGHVSLS